VPSATARVYTSLRWDKLTLTVQSTLAIRPVIINHLETGPNYQKLTNIFTLMEV